MSEFNGSIKQVLMGFHIYWRVDINRLRPIVPYMAIWHKCAPLRQQQKGLESDERLFVI